MTLHINGDRQNRAKLERPRSIIWGLIESLMIPREPKGIMGAIFEALISICAAATLLFMLLGMFFFYNMSKGWLILVFSAPLTCLSSIIAVLLSIWRPSRKNLLHGMLLALAFYMLLLSGVFSILLYLFLTPTVYFLTGGFSLPSYPINKLDPREVLVWGLFLSILFEAVGIKLSMDWLYRIARIGPVPNVKALGGRKRKIPPLHIYWKNAPLFLKRERVRLWLLYRKFRFNRSTGAVIFALIMLVGFMNVSVILMLIFS